MQKVRAALVGCGKVGPDPRGGAARSAGGGPRRRLRQQCRAGDGVRRRGTAASHSPISATLLHEARPQAILIAHAASAARRSR